MKQMRRTMDVFSILCLLVCFLFLCFAGPGQVFAADQSVIKLRYGNYTAKSGIDDLAEWFFNEVSRRSGVKLQVEYYHTGTLAKAPDCLNALGVGVYETGWISPAYTPGKIPYAMMLNAACLVGKTIPSLLAANDEFERTFAPAEAEMTQSNVKYLFTSGVWQYCWTGTKPIKSLADIKGLKGRTFGYQSKAWAALGGVPVNISISEAYDALQKGMVDGVLMSPNTASTSLRLHEVGKEFTKLNFGCLPVPVLMNLNTYNKLPDVVKKTMLEVSKETPKKGEELIAGPELGAIENMRKAGVNIINTLPDEDYKTMDKLGITITDMLVEDLTKKGVKDVRQAMDIYLKLLDKHLAQK